jgi:hypothetical protein
LAFVVLLAAIFVLLLFGFDLLRGFFVLVVCPPRSITPGLATQGSGADVLVGGRVYDQRQLSNSHSPRLAGEKDDHTTGFRIAVPREAAVPSVSGPSSLRTFRRLLQFLPPTALFPASFVGQRVGIRIKALK